MGGGGQRAWGLGGLQGVAILGGRGQGRTKGAWEVGHCPKPTKSFILGHLSSAPPVPSHIFRVPGGRLPLLQHLPALVLHFL